MSRRCTGAVLAGLLAALAAGCPPGDAPADGGGTDAPAASSTLEVALRIEVGGEPFEGDAPVDVGDGWMLRAAVVRVAELQPRSDRSPGEQLETVGPLRADLFGAERDVIFAPAPPATYAEVAMVLAADGATAAVSLRATREGVAYEVSLATRTELAPRCDGGALTLRPGSAGRLDVLFEAGELLDSLSEDVLPAPVDGVVRIDATTAPEATSRLEERLDETFSMRCDSEPSAELTEEL